MKRLRVLLGMLVLVAGWWGWVEYRRAEVLREATLGVRGRVVDVLGDPVRGCAVNIEDRDNREVAKTTTRRDGTFEFEANALGSGRKIVARAEGCVSAKGWPPSPGRGFAPMEDLVLVPGASLRGRLVGSDGRPRAGVTLKFALRPTTAELVTDAEGNFAALGLVDPGWWFVSAEGAAIRPVGVHMLPGRDQTIELVASERAVDATIHGRIVDDRGEPLSVVQCHASMMTEWSWQGPIAVDLQGHFVVEHLVDTPRGPVTLIATSPGHREAEVREVSWGARDVQVVVRRAPRVRVRVVDGAGAPVPGVPVCIGWGNYVDPETASKTDVDGVDVVSAASAGRQVVRLNWPDSLREAALVELDPADGAPGEVVLEVAEGVQRRVVVLAGPDSPVVGANLTLGLMPAARADDPPLSAAALDGRFAEIDWATTEADGAVCLLGHPTARYVLRVKAPGRAEVLTECRFGTGAEPLVIDLGAGATVRGTLRPASVLAQLQGFDAQASISIELERAREADSSGAEGTVAVDGSFAIQSLGPGDWVLRLRYVVFGRAVRTEPLAVLTGLRDGETRDVPIDVSGLAPTPLTGTLWVNATPHVGAIELEVERRGADGETHTVAVPAHTDARGRFARALPPGRCRVLALVGDAAGSQAWVRSAFFDAGPGRRAGIEVRIEAVAVDVVTLGADGAPIDALWQVVGAEDGTWNAFVVTGTRRALLAPGRHAVSVRRAALLDLSNARDFIFERIKLGLRGDEIDLDVPAGEIVVPTGQASARVELAVPEAAGY